MALFTKKTNTETKLPKAKSTPKSAVEKKVAPTVPAKVVLGLSARVLKNPRITEKATFKSESGVYTFNVYPRANKHEVVDSIVELYNVRPVKVNMVTTKPKRVLSRNKRGTRGGGKKAYVYLAKGDKIEFV